MSEVIAGRTVTLLSQWFDFEGGSLTNLDATPTITITSVATGATALAATASGITHPGTGSYGYAWTPTSTLTAGLYLATWSGLKSSAPVTATETVTVAAPASADATNTSPDGVWYATREDVQRALDVKVTARNRREIDAALEAASRSVDALCHRRFYPVVATRYYDWPNFQYAYPWRIWFDQWELAAVPSAVTSGAVTIPLSACNFEPVSSGPPYTYIELRRDQPYSFGVGSTPQRDVAITGLYGYRNTETALGILTAAVTTATATTISVDGPTSAVVGVGSVLRVDSERLIVSERTESSTGQTGTITASKGDVSLAVSDGTKYAVDEVLLLDSERMRIDDIAGNALTVERAYDGTVLAAHTAATIYAPRTLTVTRGALGTTADTHGSGSTVYRWDPPGLVHQLTKAEAITQLTQERAGWFMKASTTGQSAGRVSADAIQNLRDQTYTEHGRKSRIRVV
ncbi:hypothetical protein [Streptomyces yokosukanensis]|nr:hypothetical protein [Streptomyces yokosukanensis]